MKTIWDRLLNEPAVIFGSVTAVLAAASGIWTSPWLAFAAAAVAGIGAAFTRANVTPTVKLETDE